MAYQEFSFTTDQYNKDIQYPGETGDPKEKSTDKYGLKYVKAMYSDCRSGPSSFYYNYRYQMIENRNYSVAKQDITQYNRMVGDDDEEESYLNIDWRIVSFIPKVIDSTLGLLMRQDNPISCTAVDQLSQDKRMQDYWDKFVEIKHRSELAEIQNKMGMKMGNSGNQDQEPETIEELDIYQQHFYKQNIEIAMEQGLELIFSLNNWKEIQKKVKRNLLVDGIGGTKSYFLENGNIKCRAVEPMNMVLRVSEKPDFTDLDAVGEILHLSLSQIKKLAGNKYSDAEYREIGRQFEGKNGNPFLSYNQTSNPACYDSFKIPVMEFEFKTIDEKVWEKKYDKYGNYNYYKKENDYAPGPNGETKRERETIQYEMNYGGFWIVGSDYLWGYGPCENVQRNPSNLFEVYSSFNLYAPHLVEGRINALAERVIPFGNALQLAWIKLQALKANAAPKGVAINWTSLMNVMAGMGGEQIKPLELIKMYRQTGVLLYDGNKMGKNGGKAVEELINGIGAQIAEIQQDMQFNQQMIRDVFGVAEGLDATLPASDQPVGTARMAAQGTSNALFPIMDAYVGIKERTARNLCGKIQRVAAEIKDKQNGYPRALGEGTMKVLELSDQLSLSEFGITVAQLMSDEDRQYLEIQIQKALDAGQILQEDAFMIREVNNIKIAQRILTIRRKKREREMAMAKQQDITSNAQVQQASLSLAAKLEIEKAKELSLIKIDEINVEKGWDYMIMARKEGEKSTLEEIKGHISALLGEQDHYNKKDQATHAASLQPAEENAENMQSVAA